MSCFSCFFNNQSDIALQKKQHIHNISMQRSRCFVRPDDPPKEDGHIGGAADEQSRDAKFLV